MTPITLRRLLPADAPDYRALMLDAYERHPDAFTSSAAERSALPLAWWESRLAPGDAASSVLIGALADQKIVGVVGLEFEAREKTRHKATLFGMVVASDARRCGIGHRLVDAAIAMAGQRGVRLMQLTVTEGNAAAQSLYAKCGFRSFGLEPMAVALAGRFVAKRHMWREIR